MAFIEYKGFDHVWQYSGPWLYWLIGFYLSLPILAYILLPKLSQRGKFSNKKSATLFVLGDIGHSPRMCYHAKSLSVLDYYVTLCGYVESQPSDDVLDDTNIQIQPIKVIRNSANLPYILFAVVKIALQSFELVKLMFQHGSADFVIIQNPPLIPILFIAILYRSWFSRSTRIVIDWHNLNYSILNLKYHNLNHPIVRALKLYEKHIGKLADIHITVTNQMKDFLVQQFDFSRKRIITLHDRPGENFKPLSQLNSSKQEILSQIPLFNQLNLSEDCKILVTSTSFTPDEDLNILLDALKLYEKSKSLPPIVFIVTGKGPLKQSFLARYKELKFLDKITIQSAWLSYEDYPLVLAAADLAISLHTSSSGIDLPMKIVDFFGCGVPVITLDFPAIGELVQDNVNGIVVENSKDSAEKIYLGLEECFKDNSLLPKLTKGAEKESQLRWNENWTKSLGKVFK